MTYNIPWESIPPSFTQIIIGLLPLTIFAFAVRLYIEWMERDATKFLLKAKVKTRNELIDTTRSNEEFEKLLSMAEKEVQDLISVLPEEAKKLAEQTPCVFEPTFMTNGTDGCILGLYHFATQSINVYLGSIVEEAKIRNLDIGFLIRKVYLHELAHRFGLNEEEVTQRGLQVTETGPQSV